MKYRIPSFPGIPLALAAALLIGSCGSVEPDGADAHANGVTFEASRNYNLYHDGVGEGSSVEVKVYAPGSIAPIDAGVVAVNGAGITRRNDLATGGIFYATGWEYDQDTPVKADESMHHLDISGNAAFASFADSIRSPGAVYVTQPGLMETISKSKGCTIVWEASGHAGDSVTIEAHDGIYAYLLSKRVPDNGAVVLTNADLRGISYGMVLIGVNRANTKRSVHPDGRFSDMTISSKMLVEVMVGE